MHSADNLLTIPDIEVVETTIKKVFRLLFPPGENLTNPLTDSSLALLKGLFIFLFKGLVNDRVNFANQFIDTLPIIKDTLIKDAEFILKSDPAANSLPEVIVIYPGFFALFCHRIAHTLDMLSVPMIPRIVSEFAHKETGIDIHPRAKIGTPVSIDHGTGIVIGETSVIGNYVKLYQGVTLGALSVDKSKAESKRHPTIEDNVILYSGCTILGGNTTIGRNSIIGGNVWLTESVSPFSVVYYKSEVIIRKKNEYHESIEFFI